MSAATQAKNTAATASVTAFLVSEVRGIGPDFPADVVQVARHAVLDWLGIAVAGAGEPLVDKLLDEAREQGGNPVCTVVRHGARTSSSFAALINASAADALDFSDANLAMRGHTTPGVIATALALAEARKASGKEFLTAIVKGIEMECRVGLLANPLRKGFHPTGNLAPFGATAAAAYLLGLDAGQWAHALGIAATQSAGLLASGGTMSKPFHSGKAAANGLMAASLAKRGFVARADAIEAADGFLETHATARAGMEALQAARGRYFILDTIFKSHAACQLTHSSIDNMLQLRKAHGFSPEQVARVELQVPAGFLSVCNIQEPKTGLEGKFSLRAVAAMALLGDDTRDIGAYTAERVTRPELRRLRDRVAVKPRDDLKGGVAIATIELIDGRRLDATSDCYQPLRDLALQRERVSQKFQALAGPVLGKDRAAELERVALQADALESVAPLLQLTLEK
jgi:2-methylcitrate dehydratase PrpD